MNVRAAPVLLICVSFAIVAGCGGEFVAGDEGSSGGAGGATSGANGGALPACAARSAPLLFDSALCACGDVAKVGALFVHGGPVGINGRYVAANHSDIDGALVAYGGLEAAANLEVEKSVASAKGVRFAGRLSVGGDLMVGGDLVGLGALDVRGTLGVRGKQTLLGLGNTPRRGAFRAPRRPCGCGAQDRLDVQREVARARSDNDNRSAGLPARPTTTIGVQRMVLNSGRYYFATQQAIGYRETVINGAVSIYIDGDLTTIGHERLKLVPGSTLDLYVSGNLGTVGHVVLGERHHASALRIYVGGKGDISLSVGNQEFHGAIYAPEASLVYLGRTEITGALFVRDLHSAGTLDLGYARPTTDESGRTCKVPGSSSGKPSDAPPDPATLPRVK